MATLPTTSAAHPPLAGNRYARAAVRAPRAKLSRFYRPELDMLRFFAFFAVFLGHGVAVNARGALIQAHPVLLGAIAFLHNAGGFGLSLFFFLSSFLITTLLTMEGDRTGTVDLRSFYVRRMLRIWPLYFTFLGAAFVLGQLWSPAHFSVPALVAFFTMSTNWYVILTAPLVTSVQFLWSISVEEQFYLLWPVVVRSMTKAGIRRVCIGMLCVSFASIAMLGAARSSGLNIWFNSLAEMLFFAAGGLMALRVGLAEHVPSWTKFLGGVAACFVAWVLALIPRAFEHQNDPVKPLTAVLMYASIAAGIVCLMWAFLHVPRMLVLSPLVYLGRISFGLYVFHGLALLVGRESPTNHLQHGAWLVLAFGATVALAALSYELLEKPFLRWKHRFEVVHSRAA